MKERTNATSLSQDTSALKPPSYYWLYATTIFVSSFLLFQVQPLIGKHILPWFGGSASVWVTALFFFMVALAVGYAYSLVLSWFSRLWQLIIHTGVIGVTGLWLYQNTVSWSSGITPAMGQVVSDNLTPAWQVFVVLSLSVGLPFILLSATSTLLQYWYGVSSQKEPFSLYAVSNAGSIVGLLSYPFLLEPILTTPVHGSLWVGGFAVYVILMFLVMFFFIRSTNKSQVAVAFSEGWGVTARQFFKWVGVASVPIIAMLMGTNFVLGYVAAMPFLWVVPLTLYLLSFVLAFQEKWHMLPIYTNIGVAAVSILAILTVLLSSGLPFWMILLSVWAAIFFVSHWCHEWLYANRPRISGVPAFYVALALGGILASAAVLLVSTVILPVPVEFLLLLLVCVSVAFTWLVKNRNSFQNRAVNYLLSGTGVIFLIVTIVAGVDIYHKTSSLLVAERNFFGPKTVSEWETPYGKKRTLMHGVTNHGYQYVKPELARTPSSYYSKTSGVGKVIATMQERRGEEGISAAIIGLGSGAISAYCGDQDRFQFFEIDQEVVDIAREYFTFLESCPGSSVILGDGRLKLEEKQEKSDGELYDLVIIDAYADDAVPAHLLTTEAAGIYKKLLKPDAILAVHISSRYLDLGPVVLGGALANDMVARHRLDQDHSDYALTSEWVLLAKNKKVFSDIDGLQKFNGVKPVYWTDVYSALLPVVQY